MSEPFYMDECYHDSVDTFASGAGRRVDVCLGCEQVLRFWNQRDEEPFEWGLPGGRDYFGGDAA